MLMICSLQLSIPRVRVRINYVAVQIWQGFGCMHMKAELCGAVQPLNKTNGRQNRQWRRKRQICIIIQCQQPLLSSGWFISRSPSQLQLIHNDRSTFLHMAIMAWLYTLSLSLSLAHLRIYTGMCSSRVNAMKKWDGHRSQANKRTTKETKS